MFWGLQHALGLWLDIYFLALLTSTFAIFALSIDTVRSSAIQRPKNQRATNLCGQIQTYIPWGLLSFGFEYSNTLNLWASLGKFDNLCHVKLIVWPTCQLMHSTHWSQLYSHHFIMISMMSTIQRTMIILLWKYQPFFQVTIKSLGVAEANQQHIRFTPKQSRDLGSIIQRTHSLSAESCAYQCYHSRCCMAFSFQNKSGECSLSKTHTHVNNADPDVDVYAVGM